MNCEVMSGNILFTASLVGVFQIVLGGFPYIAPTVGRPWPLPQNEVQTDEVILMNINNFGFRSVQHDCVILQNAFSRYMNILKESSRKHNVNKKTSNDIRSILDVEGDYFTTLEVLVLQPCESYPHFEMDERYELKICSVENPLSAKLTSPSVWGALRGLETFIQLAIKTEKQFDFSFNCSQFIDYPRFPHRGILLDTARHYLPLRTIFQNLDLMAMNKFNVLHWHIVDSQSFPYQSEIFPDLSTFGAWSSIHIYTKDDITEVVEYAKNLGIRVVAEFDTPGHTESWGPGQPGLLTECYRNGKPDGSFGPIDPSNENNYEFLQNLFSEISNRFPEHYIHLGGDEVLFTCWKSNPNVTLFMEKQNITDYHKLEDYYITRITNMVENLPKKNGYIVWEEVFDNGIEVASNAIIHIWRYGNHPQGYIDELANVTAAGYQAILSSCWYLNFIGDDWPKLYDCDPRAFNGTNEQKKLILGGEACMWAEYVDETNLTPRLWPRASAVAERLWSSQDATTNSTEAEPRMEEHRCRLLNRGYPVEPLGPSAC